MSCSYADGLSAYENKGKLGEPETFDSKEELTRKIKLLSQWIEEAKHVVLHTGAGISTSAGIPDFRGPNGVWTLQKKGIKPKINISFDDAVPTLTHMAITELVKQNKVHYVVSQNIDALHLRSGLSRKYLAELHGNMYVDQCNKCERQFVRKTATNSVGQKNLHIACPYKGYRPCRGTLHDTILDWEHNLPQKDINLGDYNSSVADLSICLGTTLQINPSGMLPTYTKKYNQGKLVICNLSSTKHDKKADLLIRGYVDDILSGVMEHLNLPIPEYSEKLDPSRTQEEPYLVEWTLEQSDVLRVKRKYEDKMRENKKRKLRLKTETDGDVMDEISASKKIKSSEKNKNKIEEIEGVEIKKEGSEDVKDDMSDVKRWKASQTNFKIKEEIRDIKDDNKKPKLSKKNSYKEEDDEDLSSSSSSRELSNSSNRTQKAIRKNEIKKEYEKQIDTDEILDKKMQKINDQKKNEIKLTEELLKVKEEILCDKMTDSMSEIKIKSNLNTSDSCKGENEHEKVKLEENSQEEGGNENVEEIKKEEDEKKKKVEENNKKVEENNKKVEENNKKVEENNRKVEENSKKVEENNRKVEENNKIVEENNKRVDENNRKVEENNRKVEENSKKVEENNRKVEENNRKVEENTKIVEENNRTVEENNRKVEENNKKVEETHTKMKVEEGLGDILKDDAEEDSEEHTKTQ